MNTTAPAQSLTITSASSSPVTISRLGVSTYFAVTHNCTTLAASAACMAGVGFTPTAEGALAGTLTIA
jgi:hypothetical protein